MAESKENIVYYKVTLRQFHFKGDTMKIIKEWKENGKEFCQVKLTFFEELRRDNISIYDNIIEYGLISLMIASVIFGIYTLITL